MSQVLRVAWVPGSDRLRGECHCGAQADADDPVLLWEWLAGHPGHAPIDAGPPEPAAMAPHLVTDPALIRRRVTAPA